VTGGGGASVGGLGRVGGLVGVGEAGGTGGTEGEADAFGGREGSVHRFAAAWVRVRAAFGEGSCVLRETIRKGRPRFCWLSLYASSIPL
jgi:hypothetical protein